MFNNIYIYPNFCSLCRQEQCNILLELLKMFQSCRSYLSTTMQKAEQTISEQASYMGKENLQRLIAKVTLLTVHTPLSERSCPCIYST